LCATLGSGARLGGDRDLDGHLNGEDCSPGDATAPYLAPLEVTGVGVTAAVPTHLTWDAEPAGAGPGLTYDLAGGSLQTLHAAGLDAATACLAAGLVSTAYDDARPDPAAGDGRFYLLRARNVC